MYDAGRGSAGGAKGSDGGVEDLIGGASGAAGAAGGAREDGVGTGRVAAAWGGAVVGGGGDVAVAGDSAIPSPAGTSVSGRGGASSSSSGRLPEREDDGEGPRELVGLVAERRERERVHGERRRAEDEERASLEDAAWAGASSIGVSSRAEAMVAGGCEGK